MEANTERVVLLAQIALEGVRMTPEAQELASSSQLTDILSVAQCRSAHRESQATYYVIRNDDGTGGVVIGSLAA